MNIVSINMIIEINKLLINENAKVHLRDACGKQSMWIEKINTDIISQKAYNIVVDYFEKEGFGLVFSDDKINFWVK